MSNFQKWHGFLEYVYVDLFPPSRRPIIHFTNSDSIIHNHSDFCDPYVVVFRNWDTEGAGSFIPEYLGVDMLRAAAYRRAGVFPHLNWGEKEKLSYVQVRRVNKRRVLNEQELFVSITRAFTDTVHLRRIVDF